MSAALSNTATGAGNQENVVPEPLYNRKEFAKLAGISIATLDRRLRDGAIKPVRIGRCVRFRDHHLTEFLDEYDTSKRTILTVRNLS